jgi:hypothetical protein
LAAIFKMFAAPPGSTGNNNHQGIELPAAGNLWAVEFVAEAVGTTVSFKAQGTFDPGTVNDASANWFDLILLPSDNETAAVTIARTTVGATAAYLAQSQVRFVPRARLVTTLNTGVTYRANFVVQYRNT